MFTEAHAMRYFREVSKPVSTFDYTQMLLCSIERDSQVLTTINTSNYFSVMYTQGQNI